MDDVSFPGFDPEKSIHLVTGGGMTRVFVKGRLYMSWRSGDEVCLRLAMVQLHQCGLGTEEELAAAFGRHVNSVQRYLAGFAEQGVRGLLSERSGPKGPGKITAAVRARILLIVLREGVWELEAIQRRLAQDWHEVVSVPSIQQVLKENGLGQAQTGGEDGGAVQSELFALEDPPQLRLDLGGQADTPTAGCQELPAQEKEKGGDSGRAAASQVGDPAVGGAARRSYSSAQRLYLDQLEQGADNTYAGGLLFVPLLARYKFLPTLRKVITLPTHEGYSLEELALTLFYLDVFGFGSLEDFKRAYPEEFGLLVGRSQSPSHFTLRRFLHQVRKLGRGEALIDEFAVAYLRTELAAWGVMYIDGHFMPYYGLYPISKGWHGVRQMPMKGSYNFLAVDEQFTPWLFLIRSCTEDLLQKIPELIEKAKQIGEQAGVSRERLDRLIVLFDREGYSAQLYRYLEGKDQGEGKRRALFISWAKYADKWVNDLPEAQFNQVARVTYEIQKPEEIAYLETTRAMSKYGKIRAVVIQSGADKRRSAIYTNGSAEEIGAERIVALLCRRWGEENAIKQLLHQHWINYTPGYFTEQLEQQPMVDNPQAKELKQQRAGLVSELNRLKIELADHLLLRPALKRRNPPRSQKEVLDDIALVESTILLTDQQLGKLPAKIPFDEAHAGRKLLKLNHEKKRFLDCIKVFACNLQAEMCRRLLQYYDWQKEVLPALAMIVERSGYVKLEGGRLEVTLRRFRNGEIDYAARHLCDDLNRLQPVTLDKFHLPIRYQVQ
jgi:transposase